MVRLRSIRIHGSWFGVSSEVLVIPVGPRWLSLFGFVALVAGAMLLALELNEALPPVRTFAPGAMLKAG